MYTLIRPIAAILLGVFAIYAAQAYEPLYHPNANLGRLPITAAICGAIVGWKYLGERIGQALWLSMFMGVQSVVLTAIATAMVVAVRQAFVRGYRQVYNEVMDVAEGYFGMIADWLMLALDRNFLILVVGGGAGIGLILHVIYVGLERRRNDR